MLVTPVRAPRANAYAERWVRTVRAECLDWLLVVGRGQLAQVLRVYLEHYNAHRPHRALHLEAPDRPARLTVIGESEQGVVCRGDLLGGLCMRTGKPHECPLRTHRVAALADRARIRFHAAA